LAWAKIDEEDIDKERGRNNFPNYTSQLVWIEIRRAQSSAAEITVDFPY